MHLNSFKNLSWLTWALWSGFPCHINSKATPSDPALYQNVPALSNSTAQESFRAQSQHTPTAFDDNISAQDNSYTEYAVIPVKSQLDVDAVQKKLSSFALDKVTRTTSPNRPQFRSVMFWLFTAKTSDAERIKEALGDDVWCLKGATEIVWSLIG